MQVKVLLVDDHQILRQGLKTFLDMQPDIQVVGEAADGRAAVQLHPQVVVMDLSMPNLNGIDATAQIVSELPNAKVLALSAHSDQKSVSDALRAGASGYVLKDAAIEELVDAIKTVAAGETYLSPRVTNLVVKDYASRGDARPGGGHARLSNREREVLQLLAEGKATKEVAAVLGLSIKTAESHRRSVMEKLELYSIAELTKYAIREGLTRVDL
jgi:DNA-binding NarL/FixJ family response regulator